MTIQQPDNYLFVLGAQKYVKVLRYAASFSKKMHLGRQKSLKIVDHVVLSIDFGAIECDAEASEVEGEGDAGVLPELVPEGAGCGVAVDGAEDDEGAFERGGSGAGLGDEVGQQLRPFAIDEERACGGCGELVDDGGAGACGVQIGLGDG